MRETQDRTDCIRRRLRALSGRRVAISRELAELEITNAQDRLWEDFAEALRDFLKARSRPSIEGPVRPAALPERLAMLERDLASDLESLRQWKAIIETFYAGLCEEQRQAADQLLTQLFGV